MASEWPIVPLKEVVDVLTGFPFKGDAYLPSRSGVRVVRGDNVTEGRIRWGEKEKCWPAVTPDLKPYVLKAADLVIGMDGSKVGKNFATISVDDDGTLLAQRVARLRAKGPMQQSYLKYSVCNLAFTNYVRSIHTGTSIPHISKGQIQSFEVYLPPADEQAAIANALGALDNRIEHNRSLAANLEAIARRLFKSWFVEFDPVRAKASGERTSGLADEIAELFPDRFVESTLGEVPEGWSVTTLGEVFDLNPKRTLAKGTIAPYLDMSNTPTKGHVPDQIIHRAFSSGSKFINGDTLLARITPCLENGKAAFVDFLGDEAVGWGSTEFIVMRPKVNLPEYFGYLLARYEPFMAHAIASMSGTSGRQRVQLDSLATWELVQPSEAVAMVFGQIVEPMRTVIASANEEIRVLGSIRDLLLPRLISGKLRVSEVEEAISDAMTQ